MDNDIENIVKFIFHNTQIQITTDSFMASSRDQSSGKVAKMHLMDTTYMNINNYE